MCLVREKMRQQKPRHGKYNRVCVCLTRLKSFPYSALGDDIISGSIGFHILNCTNQFATAKR